MLKFNSVQTQKHNQNTIDGTGLLACRDIEVFSKRNHSNLHNVLDLGCGSGAQRVFNLRTLTKAWKHTKYYVECGNQIRMAYKEHILTPCS